MLIVKVKKFGVVWYIPFEMTAKSARGGTVRYPPSINRVKLLRSKVFLLSKVFFEAKCASAQLTNCSE